MDGDGVPVLAPTEPFVQPSDSGFTQVLARDGRIAAMIDQAGGPQLAARWPDGSLRLVPADKAFDFGPNGTFWLGGQSGCTGAFFDCQGRVEQRNAQGQLLRLVSLPGAFEVTGILEREGRVVVGGFERRATARYYCTATAQGPCSASSVTASCAGVSRPQSPAS